MKRRGVYIALAAVGGLALLSVLVLNPDAWGTFLLDVGASCLVQAAIALLLFGGLMLALRFLSKRFDFSLPLANVAIVAFAVSVVAALPALHWVFRRPVDVYDVGQTVLLGVAFFLIVQRVQRRLRRLPHSRPKQYHTPVPAITPRMRPRAERAEPGLETVPASPNPLGYQAQFQALLDKLGGDYAALTKLVEYERVREPRASDSELLQNAIWRWENDNGQGVRV